MSRYRFGVAVPKTGTRFRSTGSKPQEGGNNLFRSLDLLNVACTFFALGFPLRASTPFFNPPTLIYRETSNAPKTDIFNTISDGAH